MISNVFLFSLPTLWPSPLLKGVWASLAKLLRGRRPLSHHVSVSPSPSSSSAHRLPEFSFGSSEEPAFNHVVDAFQFQAQRLPTQMALQHLNETLTYAEVDAYSTLLASTLLRAGCGRDTRVCLLVERGIPMVIGILAILKSGSSYIPIDGKISTDASLAAIIQDSGAVLLLSCPQFQARTRNFNIPVILLAATYNRLQNHQVYDPVEIDLSGTCPGNEAYLIYTSGTTGVPKGVSVSHKNVTNLVCMSPGNLGIHQGTRVSQILNVAFDMCAWEILACLLNGGTLCIRGSSWADWCAVFREVEVIIATPSVLARVQPEDAPNIRVIAIAGEPCTKTLAKAWARRVMLYNCCGPTEVTIVNTMHLVGHDMTLSIGRPTPNNSVYVLDDDLNPVPHGIPGTMWAGGAGVSNGYVNLDSLTKERFRPDPFVTTANSRMYNTGDLGLWTTDGYLMHLGRKDDQVKIKGFRVELDGVAAAMQSCPSVVSAAAAWTNDVLWGFYTPASLPEKSVHNAAASIQPYYAVPTRYMGLDELPLTSNGKIDKSLLRSMASAKMSRDSLPNPSRDCVRPM